MSHSRSDRFFANRSQLAGNLMDINNRDNSCNSYYKLRLLFTVVVFRFLSKFFCNSYELRIGEIGSFWVFVDDITPNSQSSFQFNQKYVCGSYTWCIMYQKGLKKDIIPDPKLGRSNYQSISFCFRALLDSWSTPLPSSYNTLPDRLIFTLKVDVNIENMVSETTYLHNIMYNNWPEEVNVSPH